MAAEVPSKPASLADRAREAYHAASVFLDKPQSIPGYTPKVGTPDRVKWTNFAYFLAYPGVPRSPIAKGDTAGAEAWTRIAEAMSQAVYAEGQKPSPSWKPTAPTWPLPTSPRDWTAGGGFGYRRPFNKSEPQTRYHCGVDLDAAPGTPVLAVDAGVVVDVNAGWETRKNPETGEVRGVKALLLQTDSGLLVLYGGIRPGSAVVKVGERVVGGQKLAEVGVYPLGDSMLHMQMWDSPADAPLSLAQVNKLKSWAVGTPQPARLIDPSDYLRTAAKNPKAAPPPGFVDPNAPPDAGALVPNVVGNEEAEGTDAGDAGDADESTPATTDSDGGGAGVVVAVVGGLVVLGGIGAWLASRKKPKLRRAA